MTTSPPSSQSHYYYPQKLPTILLLAVAVALAVGVAEEDEQQPITLPHCPDRCGDTRIPFPFGIGTKPGCFREGFQVTCNDTFRPHRAFLASQHSAIQYTTEREYTRVTDVRFDQSDWSDGDENPTLELIDVSVSTGEARVYGWVSSVCKDKYRNNKYMARCQGLFMDKKGPFLISVARNVLVGVGWKVEPVVTTHARLANSSTYEIFLTCVSDIRGLSQQYRHPAANGSCSGRGCCQQALPEAAAVTSYSTKFRLEPDGEDMMDYPCSYAMVVDRSWYNFSTPDMEGEGDGDGNGGLLRRYPRGVPVVLDFFIRNGSCPAEGRPAPSDYACVSGNSFCYNTSGTARVWRKVEAGSAGHGYVCRCSDNYDGNPYIPNGCQDIDECKLRNLNPHLRQKYPCSDDGICKNTMGGYQCPCKPGMKGDGIKGTCTDKFPLAAKLTVGGIGGIFLIALVLFLILLRKEKQKTREFYEKNGGPTLEKAKFIKLFKKEELKPFLKSTNFIGKGGFGEVYKGLLDNEQVAVKKPISGTMLENEQFANEVIIQSQVIHKNIVRLIGCCLEVDIPMLVYEFLCNGSLHDILHGTNKVHLNLSVRLRIAAESADGLLYMHSKTNTKILHGDVKPANILLDDKFTAKISDFGISRLIARDKQHTGSVIGDMSYMDPVYLQTGLLTEKSDVYSFGVVILELISGKKATHSDGCSLVNSFLEAHKKEKKATDMFDEEIAVAENLEILDSLAVIAVECLNLDVDQRPSMTNVAERLLMLSRSCKS